MTPSSDGRRGRGDGSRRLRRTRVDEAERHAPLDEVAKLAHVAGPAPRHQASDEVRRKLGSLGPGERTVEVAREQRDVVSPRAQRGKGERDDREAVVEVLAEGALVDAPGERPVGRGDDADVDGAARARAHAPYRARLDGAEELGLQRERHLADLVEEERAAVRLLEDALAVRRRAGERAPHVAEELTLDQVLGDGSAVDGDEGARCAGRAAWSERARTSLPVPVSPSTSSVASVAATRSSTA